MRFIPLTEFSGALSNRLHISGRTGCSPDGSPFLNPLTLFWTASGIECAVKNLPNLSLFADIECDYKSYRPWISVWINGKRVRRLAPEKGRTRLFLWNSAASNTAVIREKAVEPAAESAEQGTIVYIRILKECQAMAGDSAHRLAIYGFYIGKSGESENVFADVFEDVFAPVPERPRFF